MNRLLCTLSLLMAAQIAFTQSSRVDSLTRLIDNSTSNKEKAQLLLQRSRIAPPAWTTPQAVGDAQQALAIYQQTGEEKGQVDAYLRLSGLYSFQSKYQAALSFDSIALDLAQKVAYKQGIALACSNMGRNYQSLGELEKARTLLTQSLQILREAGMERETGDVYSRLGVINRRLGDFKTSLQHYDEGIAIAVRYKMEPLQAILYMNKANSLNESARYDEAIQLHLESIRIKEKLHDERGLMQSFNNLANVYFATAQFEKAISYQQKALSLYPASQNQSSLANAYNNLGNSFAQTKQIDSAEFYFKKSIGQFSNTNEQPGLALAYNNLGNFYIDQERYTEGLEYLQQALTIRRKSNAKYEVASTMNNIGAALTKLQRYKEAEDYLLQSLQLVKGNNSSLETGIYKRLSEHYKATGDFEEAYKYQSNYASRKDTLLQESEILNMAKASADYEIEKRETALTLQKKEKEIQTLQLAASNKKIWLLIAGILLLATVLVMYIRSYRQKKKTAALLAEKNTRIETLVRELHHRVKNNLQVVSGLLSLQSNRLEEGAAKEAMEESRNRIHAMSMIHQRLYMDNELATVDITDYLQHLSQSLANSFGYDTRHVSTKVRLTDQNMPIDLAVPIGLIVNELVTNSFKHAFRDVLKPEVAVTLEQKKETLELRVADNGQSNTSLQAPATSTSFGMKLVHTLVAQVNGELSVDQSAGTSYTILIRA
ncbi:MAG: tetratricopeptide repeat protein [Niastella sp.]|nr:tetratricopeptide repeat protein [Niastella sp.]